MIAEARGRRRLPVCYGASRRRRRRRSEETLATRSERILVPLRITLVRPPKDVAFAVQTGRDGLQDRSIATGEDLSFDVTVEAAAVGEGVRFYGPVVQGPPAARFVYIRAGTLAGQPQSFWTRRVKVPLVSLSWTAAARAAASSTRIEARLDGRATDGGPACATVKLLQGWRPLA
ncbi:MAG: DUF5990 family protein [Vicinamibacteria bacterium]